MFLFVEYIVEQEEWDEKFELIIYHRVSIFFMKLFVQRLILFFFFFFDIKDVETSSNISLFTWVIIGESLGGRPKILTKYFKFRIS